MPLVERLCDANDLGADVREAATRAAGLCKADLVSRLVGEFSALQGYAGSVYAAEAGEPADVCAAIEEHHRPDEAGGELPASPAGAVVALADKGDTIQVAFAAGLEPTGSRDPYGLRRAAAGLVAIALDRRWRVDLPALVGDGGVGFVLDRLEPVLLEEGVTIEEVRAARGSGETEPAGGRRRGPATSTPFAGPRRDAVRDAYGRCARIAGETAAGPLDEALLSDPAERALADALAAGERCDARRGGRPGAGRRALLRRGARHVRRRGRPPKPARARRERPRPAAPSRGFRTASRIGWPRMGERLEIHIVSDSTGDTGARVARAAQSQFEDTEIEMVRHARVHTREQLARALESAAGRRAAVFYTLVDAGLREAVVELAREHNLVVQDVLGPALNAVATASGREATMVPGRTAPLDAQYFRRIAAIEFAVKHDDGRGADDLSQADVVLIGVSRTSKTPTSMHLGYMGYMAANIPIVRGVDPPPSLFQIDHWKLVGLTIDAERLSEIRRRRVRALAAGAGARYADLEEIYEELELTAALHKRLGCPVIDVTGLAIEETAARVAELVEARRRAALEGARA